MRGRGGKDGIAMNTERIGTIGVLQSGRSGPRWLRRLAGGGALFLLGFCLLAGSGWAARVEKDVSVPAELEKDQDSAVVREERVAVQPNIGIRAPEPPPGRLLPRDGFRLRMWTDRTEYRDGESVRIYFRVTRDAYVYLFDRDTRGTSRQIFPNYYDQENYLRAGVTYSIPDNHYSLVVEGPPGREELDAVAVLKRGEWHHRLYGRFDQDAPFPARPEGHRELMRSLRESGEAVEEEPLRERGSESYRPEGGERESYRSEGSDREKSVKPERPGEAQGIRIVPKPYPPSSARVAQAHASFEIVRPRGFFWWSHEDEARLHVTSDPERARVYVDGDYQGTSPVEFELKPGMRSIQVEKEGYHPGIRRIRVEEGGRTRTEHFVLEPKVYRYVR